MQLAAAEALSQRKLDCFVCSNISAAQPAAESCVEHFYPTWIMRSGLPMPSVILVRTMPACTATLHQIIRQAATKVRSTAPSSCVKCAPGLMVTTLMPYLRSAL